MKRNYIALIQCLDPLRRLIKDVKASAGLKCPNCSDVGYYTVCDGDFPEQVQCEFCYTVVDSIFNRNCVAQDIAETMPPAPGHGDG